MTDNINEKKMNQTQENLPSDAEQKCAGEEAVVDEFESEAEALKAAIETGDFDIKEFLHQYKEAIAAQEELNERLLRLQADFENYRRRSRRDAEEAGKNAQGELISTILPILDNFDRALALMNDSADKEGVVMISNQLKDVLQNVGLAEIKALGESFDPNIHHSVAQQDVSEEQKGKILSVLQKGYMFNDKLLRAPLVQVGV